MFKSSQCSLVLYYYSIKRTVQMNGSHGECFQAADWNCMYSFTRPSEFLCNHCWWSIIKTLILVCTCGTTSDHVVYLYPLKSTEKYINPAETAFRSVLCNTLNIQMKRQRGAKASHSYRIGQFVQHFLFVNEGFTATCQGSRTNSEGLFEQRRGGVEGAGASCHRGDP